MRLAPDLNTGSAHGVDGKAVGMSNVCDALQVHGRELGGGLRQVALQDGLPRQGAAAPPGQDCLLLRDLHLHDHTS